MPAQFERAKFHILVRNPKGTALEFEVRIQEHLDVALRQIGHRGFTGPSYKEKILYEKDLANSTQELEILLHQSCTRPHQSQKEQQFAKRFARFGLIFFVLPCKS